MRFKKRSLLLRKLRIGFAFVISSHLNEIVTSYEEIDDVSRRCNEKVGEISIFSLDFVFCFVACF